MSWKVQWLLLLWGAAAGVWMSGGEVTCLMWKAMMGSGEPMN